MARSFAIVHLPRKYDSPEVATHLATLATKLKAIRLEALKTDPDAFGSTYEREVAFTDEQWAERLTNPLAQHVVALDLREPGNDMDGKSDLEMALAAPFVGTTVLIGPRAVSSSQVSDSQMSPSASPWAQFHDAPSVTTETLSPGTELQYAMNGVWVHPNGRRAGLGKQLIDGALEAGKRDMKRLSAPKRVNGFVVVFVEKDNEPATGLYEACGFKNIGEEEYTSAGGKEGVVVALRQNISLN
ncbi:hypothetical protein BT63DRAFT_422156 [Microthyrium microscopicum]|uniref:N-acetyltransferase domain-containing protein n=1 Tax=Microthyrium microscopicum TaxID=703497 RepID=A0A6A6UJF5_9PEZI|nr:hypothetical protein BT63DRAFT_422156 [Microthyrium microscopicum]